MALKPWIIGVEGLALSEAERDLIRTHEPAGFILFQRNCDNPAQVTALVNSLHEVTGRDDLLILIDQEGGRVARLKPPHWRKAPPAAVFAGVARNDPKRAERMTYLNARLLAEELISLGITVNCAPLADIPVTGSHDIIGDRAFGHTPEQVAALGAAMAKGLLEGGVLPVLKHIPGHGRATADSHEELPTVTASLAELRATDFIPFQKLCHLPLGMTAHIRYTAIDEKLPATLSPTVIKLIREEIGFTGLLMSDDLSMKALSGSMGELTKQTLAAGCDLVLHCNGKMEEMQLIADSLPTAADALNAMLADCFSLPSKPAETQLAGIKKEFEDAMAEVAAA